MGNQPSIVDQTLQQVSAPLPRQTIAVAFNTHGVANGYVVIRLCRDHIGQPVDFHAEIARYVHQHGAAAKPHVIRDGWTADRQPAITAALAAGVVATFLTDQLMNIIVSAIAGYIITDILAVINTVRANSVAANEILKLFAPLQYRRLQEDHQSPYPQRSPDGSTWVFFFTPQR